MDKFPPDQKIKGAKKKKVMENSGYEKTPRAKFQDPSFRTSEGDLGVRRNPTSDIPKQTKAPTLSSDGISHAMKNIMKKSGMLTK